MPPASVVVQLEEVMSVPMVRQHSAVSILTALYDTPASLFDT
jgi:hypothetical protein